MDWILFCDLFLGSVGNNQSLSNSKKLQYLKLSVKLEAATLLLSIQISDENYEIAWKILSQRFENESEIINSALNKLISQPVLKHESASGLRKLIDTTQQCIDTLKILKQPVQHWDTIIIFLLKGKLDNETLKAWTLEQQTNKTVTFENFKAFILNRSIALSSLAKCQKEKPGQFDSAISKKQINKYSCSAQITSNSCIFCKSDSHFRLYNCDKFLEIPTKEKWNFIKKYSLCGNCLRENKTHNISNCRAGMCKICSKPHNTILCSRKSSENKI